MDLRAYAHDVLDPLTAVGIRATTDWRDATTPGVVAAPAIVEFEHLSDDAHTITWELILVGNPAGTMPALDDLGTLAEQVHNVWPEAARFETRSVHATNLSGDPLPALRTTITLIHTKE